MGGRHRAQTKPLSRLVAPGLIVLVLPTLVVFGYIQLVTQEPIPQYYTNTYASAYPLSETPPTAVSHNPPITATTSARPTSVAAPTVVVVPAPAPSTTSTEPPRPSEKDVEPPVTTSTIPPTQPHQTQDQKPPTTSSAPTPKKIKNSPKCSSLSSADSVVRVCNALMAEFPDINDMGGRAERPDNPTSCHPHGLGLDVMVSKSVGDKVNAWAIKNAKEYGIAYIAWQVADHYDHVHLSLEPCKG